ncbi:UPF0175 family protein [Halorussus salinus]|uniref:UPF0175 family protein n=1 Tax=Halorussus salinus TaxID=1364935 RepID=UPI001091EE75|nr:UPF0175 family protein [Halorussus salinus]
MENVVSRKSDEELVRFALAKYRHGEVGMRGAADIAGLSIAEMMTEANERDVRQNYDETDLESDVANLGNRT